MQMVRRDAVLQDMKDGVDVALDTRTEQFEQLTVLTQLCDLTFENRTNVARLLDQVRAHLGNDGRDDSFDCRLGMNVDQRRLHDIDNSPSVNLLLTVSLVPPLVSRRQTWPETSLSGDMACVTKCP